MGYTDMLRDGASPTEMREYLVDGETTAVTIRIPRNLRDSAKKLPSCAVRASARLSVNV